mgnify:CR=1 FL=1
MQKPFKKVLSGNIILIIFFEIAYSNVKLKKTGLLSNDKYFTLIIFSIEYLFSLNIFASQNLNLI